MKYSLISERTYCKKGAKTGGIDGKYTCPPGEKSSPLASWQLAPFALVCTGDVYFRYRH